MTPPILTISSARWVAVGTVVGSMIVACARSEPGAPPVPPVASAPAGSSASASPPAPPPSAVPAIPAATAGDSTRRPPPGFELRTVHHRTIHAELFVPRGDSVSLEEDAYGYPRVRIRVGDELVFVQFDSGVGAMAVTLARDPPKVYSLPVVESSVSDQTVAAWYRSAQDDLRITGVAPGVKCTFESFRPVPRESLESIYTVCSSLRTPRFGEPRASTQAERSHGGMTAVPDGAWVEDALPKTPGAMLRPGAFIARLHMGRMTLSGGVCPPSYEPLAQTEAPEVQAAIEQRDSTGGPVWIRRATEEYDGMRYPGPTVLWAPRDGSCCRAVLVPWIAPPSDAQLAEAIALCDTFEAQ